MKKITLLSKASLAELKFEYLTTILKQRLPKNVFTHPEVLNISITIVRGNRTLPMIKLYDVKIDSIESLVEIMLKHLETYDQDTRFDIIKLGYFINKP